MKITCEKCGAELTLNGLGRRGYDVGFAEVCKACQQGLKINPRGVYSEAAKILSKKLKKNVTPGFVHKRITRQAVVLGISHKVLIEKVLNSIEGRPGQ